MSFGRKNCRNNASVVACPIMFQSPEFPWPPGAFTEDKGVFTI